MVATELIPVPDTIPVAWGWLEALLVSTFAVHILLMNAVVGGAIFCAVRSVSFRSDSAVREMSHSLPTLFALTVNLGVAPLLFAQMLYGQFFYTSSVLMAAYWLAVVFLAIAAYSGLYVFRYRYDSWPSSRWILAMTCGILLLIGFIFTNNMTLMLRPDVWTTYFTLPDNMGGTILNLDDPALLPRYLHFMIAAVAVGGLTLALLFDLRLRKGSITEEQAQPHIRFGMTWFTIGTVAQLMIGVTFLGALPAPMRSLFLGGSDLHTGAFIIALVCVAITLHYAVRRKVRPTAIALAVTVLAMSILRALVRAAYLAPYFTVQDMPVHPDYSPLVMFLLSLAAGLWCIYYMIRLAFRPGKEG